RREFINKSIIAAAGLAIGARALNDLFLANPAKLFQFGREPGNEEFIKEAYYYQNRGSAVQCLLCPKECTLSNNTRSICRARYNKDGILYTLAYANPCSMHVDPIEKKPLYHYMPTTTSFSIATGGCNFTCLNCQNWEISQSNPDELETIEVKPEAVVEAAQRANCKTIAYTYSEPSIFYEYMLDTSRLAAEQGIKNLWITNGYLNEKPFREFSKYLGAANVDLKGFDDNFYIKVCSGTRDPVLNTLKILKEQKNWFEVTHLMIPTLNEDMDKLREMAKWIYKNLGTDYPLHFSRFSPAYKLTHLPATPVKLLEAGRKIAVEEGIKYVYIGNVPGHEAQNTYCPNCGKIVVKREGYAVGLTNLNNSACVNCGESIAGIWS
ncbi:AmmeMemoRadiSam system radical SAM enzyme, partial [Candidatus Woesearchaeota archaeon]|nr:AmmeMemoRadiSam system radical SAM enzyme [Candidatus Woesearchaeota archaeon]